MTEIKKERVEKYFKELASISSPSWDEGKVISYIENFAKKRKLAFKKFQCGKSFNVMISLKGNSSQ